MTRIKGKRYMVAKGTTVRDHVLGTERTRKTSYPVHVHSVSAGRVYWFGDCSRLMSCSSRDVNLRRAIGPLYSRRGRS